MWLLVDFSNKGLRIDPYAVVLVTVGAVTASGFSYLLASRRGGRLLIKLKAEQRLSKQVVELAVTISAVLFCYVIGRLLLTEPAPAFVAMILLWMYTINQLLVTLLVPAIGMRSNGVVVPLGFGWHCVSWAYFSNVTWSSTDQSILQIGHWWSPRNAIVPPSQRHAVEAILAGKLSS